MTDTYGNSSVPGVSITTSRDILEKENMQQMKDLGLVEEDSYQWSHNLKPIGSNSIKCSHCGMEEEIPELVQRSTGFRTVVYKLYILGKFKNARCEGKYETDHSVLNTRVDIASQLQFHISPSMDVGSDLSSAGVDTSSDTTSVNVDMSDMSMREKAAKKLCDKAGLR